MMQQPMFPSELSDIILSVATDR